MPRYYEIKIPNTGQTGVWKTNGSLPDGVEGKPITIVRARELTGILYASDIKEGLTVCDGKPRNLRRARLRYYYDRQKR